MAAEFDCVIRGGTVVDGTGHDPVVADVAIRDGKIAAVGKIAGKGTQEIDASGRLVTPGFIDIHTHYDGQAIWSTRMNPSSSHGVTTVVMGNCGVGFAPCRKADHDMLINVMEGVEDIPGNLPAISRCSGRPSARYRHRRLSAALAAARLCHGRTRGQPRAGDP
jgi:N-acyl-D-aspartate/D-glutamate deacylase